MWPDDDTDLPVEVWAAFGADPAGDPGDWTFTELTDRLGDNPIPLRRGATAGGTVSASSATLHLLNDDGALTPLYAPGIYYPNVVLGTPIWVPLRRAEDDFDRTESSGWGSTPDGQPWTRTGGTAANFSVSSGSGLMAHATINDLRRARLSNTLLDSHQIVDVSTSALITGAAMVGGLVARYVGSGPDYYWGRVEFNPGTTTVNVKITRVRAGVLTDLDSTTVAGLTYAASTPLRTRMSVVGDQISIKAWTAAGTEPVGWHLEVTDPDPLTDPGATGVQSWVISGNTNVGTLTTSFDNYVARVDLMNGFADSWVPTFVPTTDGDVASIVRVTVSGILRRLGQGTVSRSAATRYLAGTDPILFHPFEDGEDSTQAASGIVGGTPMSAASGIMDFTDDAPPGASGSAHPMPSAANALVGTIAGASTTGFQVGVWTKATVTTEASDAHYIPWEIRTDRGLIFRSVMQYLQTQTGTSIGVALYTSEDQETPAQIQSLSVGPALSTAINGEWKHLHFMARQSGANVDVFLWLDGTLLDFTTWNSITLGAPVRVNSIGRFSGPTSTISLNMRDIWLSQLVVHDSAVFQIEQYEQGLGFPGELASDRVERIGEERNLSIYVHPGDSERLGPQPAGGDLDVLRDIEAVDGILYERGWGLGYRPNSTRYNQAPALVVDLAPPYMHSQETRPEQVVAPTYDDQGTRNDVTASRRDGSSARVIDSDHAARHGVYDDSVELGVATDEQLPHHASWRVHLGTWEEMRYPSIPVDLAGNPDLIDAWLNLAVGDRVQQTNVPAPHPPEDVDQLAAGMSQTITRRGSWTGQVVGYPARPWTVGVVEDDILGRADTDGSKFVPSVVSGTTTSALVAVVDGPPWITTANQSAMFPFDVRSGGAVLTVTGIADAVTDSFTRSASSGWGTATTGQAWSVNSGTASEFSVTSNQGRMAMVSTNDLHVVSIDVGSPDADPTTEVVIPVVPTGAGFTVRSIARMTTVADYYYAELTFGLLGVVTLRLFKRVSNTATQLGSSVVLPGTHAGGNRWTVQCSAVGDTIRARGWKSTSPVEVGWHIIATDTALTAGNRVGLAARRETSNSNGSQNVDFDNFAVPSLQTFTLLTTPVNGVIRTIPAGESVSLANPWRLAL